MSRDPQYAGSGRPIRPLDPFRTPFAMSIVTHRRDAPCAGRPLYLATAE